MPKRLIEAAMWVLLCWSLGALLAAAGAYAPAWVPIGGSSWVLGVGAWLALRLGGLLLLLRGPAVAQAVLAVALAWAAVGERLVQASTVDLARWWPLARAVAAAGTADGAARTGSQRFDGEWRLATCAFGLVGLGRMARAMPEEAEETYPALRACGAWLASPEAASFGEAAWSGRGGDHAWKGYALWGLAEASRALPEASLRGATRRLAADLAPLLERDPLTVETYPGEIYPPDLAVLGAGLAAAARAEGREAPPQLEPWLQRWSAAIDPTSGLLVQALVPGERAGGDRPRGSGTALAAAALAEADPALARRLGAALQDRWVGPFAAVREVAVGEPPKADIDSGPVLFGVGVSATGFGLGAARAAGPPAAYRGRLRTALLFGGLPRDVGPLSLGFVSGGALGNALLLAMVTTPGCDPVVDSRPAGR